MFDNDAVVDAAGVRIAQLAAAELAHAVEKEEFGVIVEDVAPLDLPTLVRELAKPHFTRSKRLRVSLVGEKDVVESAKARFGSLAAVLAAPVEDLMTVKAEDTKGRMKGIGTETALDLAALHEVARRVIKEEANKRTVISSWTALVAYVRLSLQHEAREQFRVLYLDNRNQLILDEIQNRGTVDHAPVYPREVVRRALELSARSMIIVHNHPSGDPTPSRPDIEMTRQIIEAARALGIDVHDHLIVGRDGVASFKQLGLM